MRCSQVLKFARDSKRLELLVGLQESLLDHVFGVLRIAGHPVREPVDSAAMALDERPKSFAISVAGECDGGGVRLRHPIA